MIEDSSEVRLGQFGSVPVSELLAWYRPKVAPFDQHLQHGLQTLFKAKPLHGGNQVLAKYLDPRQALRTILAETLVPSWSVVEYHKEGQETLCGSGLAGGADDCGEQG